MVDKTHAPRPPLRLGILLDGWVVPRWTARMIEILQSMPSVEMALVIENDTSDLTRPDESALSRLVRNRRGLAFYAYGVVDRKLFGEPDDAFAECDARRLLAGVPAVKVTPRRKRHSDYFSEDDLETIAGYGLDVALRHGFRILRGGALKIARHGIWSFHHGDNRVNRGGPPGTWEVFRNEPTTGAVLQVLTERLDDGRVLGRVMVRTDRRSVRRNCNNLYWRALPLVPRALQRLYDTGQAQLTADTGALAVYDRRLYLRPTNRETTRAVASIALRYAHDKIQRALYLDQWQLRFRLARRMPALRRFTPIVPPPDRFWADPFPIERDDRYWIFIEELVYAKKKGRIAVIEMDRKGNWREPRTVLELPTHLSYPLVFGHDDGLYMLPETGETGTVDLYRCTRFPDGWQKVATLLQGRTFVDSTLQRIDDTWWLWTSVVEPGTTSADDTHLFRSDSPMGPFTPVTDGPIISDPRTARGAGRLFRHAGRWVRPVQDGTGRYGRALRFQSVECLDGPQYREREIGRIEPFWSPEVLGVHTFNRAGRLHVVDCIVRRPRDRGFSGLLGGAAGR